MPAGYYQRGSACTCKRGHWRIDSGSKWASCANVRKPVWLVHNRKWKMWKMFGRLQILCTKCVYHTDCEETYPCYRQKYFGRRGQQGAGVRRYSIVSRENVWATRDWGGLREHQWIAGGRHEVCVSLDAERAHLTIRKARRARSTLYILSLPQIFSKSVRLHTYDENSRAENRKIFR